MNNNRSLNLSSRFAILFFVLAAVGLNVLSAIALKYLADLTDLDLLLLGFGVGIVLILNALRLLVWHQANKRYPLSTMYPLTSLFYPVMLLVSYLYREPVTYMQILGTILITVGVFWLGWRFNANEQAI